MALVVLSKEHLWLLLAGWHPDPACSPVEQSDQVIDAAASDKSSMQIFPPSSYSANDKTFEYSRRRFVIDDACPCLTQQNRQISPG
jgi:hypothetical protein